MMKPFVPVMSIMMSIFLCSGCSSAPDGLEEVEGTGLAFSENFNAYDGLNEREHVEFYKPAEAHQLPPSILGEHHLLEKGIDSDLMPFEVNEENAYVVTSEDRTGKVTHQVQLSYLGKSEEGIVDEFFIISVTEMEKNPVENYEVAEATDSVGNRFEKQELSGDDFIFQQVLTTNSALLYRYYEYDAEEEQLNVVGTAANEFYSYHDGFVYHIGYLIERKRNTEQVQDNMLNLTRTIILGKDLAHQGR
ncbi:hypothetical protein M1Q06_08210 [Planococcus sp. 11815]|uniref:hypothetical protein n=1 Tax=Planococcus sp. 11815 TaxID=2939413 RepID=UPI003DA55C0E